MTRRDWADVAVLGAAGVALALVVGPLVLAWWWW